MSSKSATRLGSPVVWLLSALRAAKRIFAVPARTGGAFVLLLSALAGSCVPTTPRENPPIVLLGTVYLEPPAIKGPANVYKPSSWAPIVADNSAGRAAGLVVSVAVASGRDVQMRLLDTTSGEPTAFVRVEPPPAGLDAPPQVFSPEVAAHLSGGTGVFWLLGSGDRADQLEQRFAVLIPETRLSAFTRLQVFDQVVGDGSPALPAEVELVRDFFYLAIIGDSVQWGNGLPEAAKMSTLASAVIERETGRKVIQQRYAHSGARIVPAPGDGVCEYSCFGEVPIVYTSITRQADQIQRPDLLDLVLMDGCFNDVGLSTVLSPLTDPAELTSLTVQFCDTEMTALLHKVCTLAPQAHIVVTGYYEMVSEQSDISDLLTWQTALGDAATVSADDEAFLSDLLTRLTQNSTLFRDTAHAGLRAAVDRVNADAGGSPRIEFADPQFGPDNAVFTPNRWLWGASDQQSVPVEELQGLLLFPEDPIAPERFELCLNGLAADSTLLCIFVSVGHPNQTGAQAFSAAIVRSLRDMGVLPANTPP